MYKIKVFDFAMKTFKGSLFFKHLIVLFLIKNNKTVSLLGYVCLKVRCVLSLSLSSACTIDYDFANFLINYHGTLF